MRPKRAVPFAIGILMLSTLLVRAQTEPQRPLYAPGEILIKMRPELGELKMIQGQHGVTTGIGSLDRLNRQHGVARMDRAFFPLSGEKGNSRVAQLAGGLARIYSLKMQEGRDIQEAVRAYERDPHVVYAQPNYLNQLCVVPNDSLYHEQWALTKMQMSAAWEIERGN